MTLVDLIRHGEPVGGRRYRGQVDDPLSERGWRQMRVAVAPCQPWQQIVTSSLRRCSEFAHELGRQHGIPVTEEARFREIGFGVWEGRSADEIRAADPQALSRFYRDPQAQRPDGAEPLADFHGRVQAAWQDVLARHAGAHVLVVGHAGVIRAVLCHVLGMPPAHMFRLRVANAGISRIRIGEDNLAVLEFHNSALPAAEADTGPA